MQFRIAVSKDAEQLSKVLSVLSDVPDVDSVRGRLDFINSSLGYGPTIYVGEIGFPTEIVCCGTLLVEPKLIHNCGLLGHIEDVATHMDYQGYGFGKQMVNFLCKTAKDMGCYRCVLQCLDSKVGFYEKCGFSRHDVGMRINFNET